MTSRHEEKMSPLEYLDESLSENPLRAQNAFRVLIHSFPLNASWVLVLQVFNCPRLHMTQLPTMPAVPAGSGRPQVKLVLRVARVFNLHLHVAPVFGSP